jgi:hypothetical protein
VARPSARVAWAAFAASACAPTGRVKASDVARATYPPAEVKGQPLGRSRSLRRRSYTAASIPAASTKVTYSSGGFTVRLRPQKLYFATTEITI